MLLARAIGFSSGKLGRKLLAYLLIFSSFVTTLTSGFILYSDYTKERDHKDFSLSQIQLSYLPTLSQSLWDVDMDQLALQLEGIKNFPYIAYANITGAEGEFQQVGDPRVLTEKGVHQTVYYDLVFERGDEMVVIGQLSVVADVEAIYQYVYERAWIIVITQFIKTMLVSIFVLFIVHHLITRHMQTLARWAQAANLSDPVRLHKKKAQKDELDQVVDSLNSMRSLVIDSIQQRDHALGQLEESNKHLEEKVDERTAELLKVIEQLNDSYNHLSATKRQLVESEKMAEMGSLVAGVAHELNTPLGICVTVCSLLESSVKDMVEKKTTTGVSKQDFDNFLDQLDDSVTMMVDNVNRASSIVQSFKRLAVKRTAVRLVSVKLRDVLESCVADEALALSQNKLKFSIDCPDSLSIESYEGTLETIVMALVHNSIEHGVGAHTPLPLEIRISVQQLEQSIVMDYQDSGVGLSENVQQQIFEPFFTTTRHKGSVGLGMHLTFNLITQILNGSIVSKSPQPEMGIGAHFELVFPMRVHQEELEALPE